tara:strand:+ start:187 stop:699 length:513 start_codon:yes stop_codon:yes gene_type:complete
MVGKLFTSAAVSAGASYVKDTLYEGSFLQKTFSDIGTATGLDKIFGSDPVGQGAFKVGKGVAQTVVDRMLGQGIGADPRSGRGFPGGPSIPSGDTFASKQLAGARKYNGFPQGSTKILEKAFDIPEINDMAMKYYQSKIPSMRVVDPTIRYQGMDKLAALSKGVIKSTKI